MEEPEGELVVASPGPSLALEALDADGGAAVLARDVKDTPCIGAVRDVETYEVSPFDCVTAEAPDVGRTHDLGDVHGLRSYVFYIAAAAGGLGGKAASSASIFALVYCSMSGMSRSNASSVGFLEATFWSLP